MKRWARASSGFTIVELLIVVAVIGILAAIAVLAYVGIQERAATAQVVSTLKEASDAITTEALDGAQITSLPDDFKAPEDVAVIYTALSSIHYSGLTSVQKGVLLYDICNQLLADPHYSTIHPKNGSGSSTVVMSCDDNVQAGRIQITGWDTKTWTTPVSQSQLEQYMQSVPYDSWWTDKQDVIRGFYAALIVLYTTSGGSWPITSFWDPWANQWSGVPKQTLPAPDSTFGASKYCIQATHRIYGNVSYKVTTDKHTPELGACL